MSRPVGNKFADFFPNAPSVIQQRKSTKSLDHSRDRSEASEDHTSYAQSKYSTSRQSAGLQITNSQRDSRREHGGQTNGAHASSEDLEPLNGDLLNGVGSASSTSTVFSVFSSGVANSNMPVTNGAHFNTLTPLTNSDGSPRGKVMSPSIDSANQTATVLNHVDLRPHSSALTPQHTPPSRSMARDPSLTNKGTKCVYDPELDKAISSRDKRKMRATFAEFGTKIQDNEVPADPRLTIPGYSKGISGKQKSKLRLAPYTLRPWMSEALPPPAAGPPTTVVVSGFDPLAPLAQIMALFSSFGEIGDLDNKTDPGTGRFLGICSIKYQDCASFQGGGPISAALAAKQAYLEGKKGQRIGVRTVRIDIDKDGLVLKRLVDRSIAVQRKESGWTDTPKPPTPTLTKPPTPTTMTPPGPPPTAPKGPSAKVFARPVSTPFMAPTFPPSAKVDRPPKPNVPSLVETSPIIEKIKNTPHLFIAHCYVPVLSTTIPHLKKRLRMYDWREVRCDESGYFITFENSTIGSTEAKKVYSGCHMHPLFTYTMNMELRLNTQATTSDSLPTPARTLAEQQVQRHNLRLRKEHDADLEEEKRQRARDLDPCRAVIQLVVQEIRDKLIEDVKSRIAGPVLYEYLDPKRHSDKRQKYGIQDPAGFRRQGYSQSDELSSMGTPDSRAEPAFGRQDFFKKNLNILSLPKIGKRFGLDRGNAGYRDERRKAPAPRPYIRPLFHQLAQFHDEDDSDDERHTSLTRDTDELESRPPSRMSMTSVSDDDDELLRKATKRRLHAREGSEMGDSFVKGEPDVSRTTAEDLIISKLERSLYEMSPSSRKRKRLVKELEARKRQKADDELFGIGKLELDREDSVDIRLGDSETQTEVTPEVEPDIARAILKKPKPKKKTKKQLAEEKEAMRRAQIEAEAAEVVDDVLDFADQEEAQAEAAERRPEVEWGVSTEEARPTVDDDEDLIPDLAGLQATLIDEDDIQFLSEALRDKLAMNIGNLAAWSWKQEQLKALRRGGQVGLVRTEPLINGYYVRNPTGSARTEPVKKILESEKSKYLPHRIKVQKARERREQEAKTNPGIVKAVAELPKASSRGKRADDRRTVKDMDRQREMLQAMGDDADVLRFNQLQKRKKPVKFARSAIHNWGLYSLERVQAGEMIIEYVGEKIRQAVADLREIRYTESGIGSSYLFRIDEGTVVDATKKGGIARFINHSCSPNCTAKIIRVGGSKRIVIYALRDIEKGKYCTKLFLFRC